MANQKKRGVRPPVRLIATGLMIVGQLALLIYLIYALSDRAILVYALFELVSIVVVVHIVNKPGNPSYKITWILLILIFPLFGGLFYMIWGGNRIRLGLRRRWDRLEKSCAPLLQQDPRVPQALEYADLLHARQSRYLWRESGYPVYGGTHAEYLSPGERAFDRLAEELERAQESIYLEFFILAEGVLWDRLHRILTRKAAQGLDVRILFDDFGSINRQYRGFVQGLRAEGIKVAVFNKLRPSPDVFMNNRNHRKIVVVDGTVAFTGGLNIGDEYINVWRRHGHWMDCAVLLTGDAAYGFQLMFLKMWCLVTKTEFLPPRRPPVRQEPAEGFVQPYCDGPINHKHPAEGIYMQIINTAQRYVYITTPYLILDNEMKTVLSLAAKSGIDVRIITPRVYDKWYVHPVTRWNYGELLKAGVRIYEYTPGFIHSKLFVSDDRVATVGTVNMDYRSFYFHFECGAWLCGGEAVLEIRDHVGSLFEQCEQITLAQWKRRPWKDRFMQALLHLFAPFM